MNKVLLSYPAAFLALCVLLGAAYAVLLYWREKRFDDAPLLRMLLALLRFTVVFVLAVLLLEPVLRYFDVEVEPPIVVVAVDNSQSIALGRDSASVRTSLPQMIEDLKQSMDGEFTVVPYTFGQSVKEGLQLDFSEPVTDLNLLFEEVKNRYTNRNLGAVVVATDGLYNRGANPRYTIGNPPWMVMPIALGDTTVQRDARIAEVAANRIAYLGNRFPVEVVLEAQKYEGSILDFSVEHKGQVIHSERVTVQGDAFRQTVRLLPEATATGAQKYTLRIAALEGELSTVNNVREVYVDVIDGRQKVLIMAAAPHPDLGAIRLAISSNERYEADLRLLSEGIPDLKAYDLIVLHQIPGSDMRNEQLRLDLLQTDKPILAIVGTQSVPAMLARYDLGVDLAGWKGGFHDVGAHVADGFVTFKLPEGLEAFLRDAPPLKVPFGDWRKANSADVLLYQRVGTIRTDDPLLLVNQTPRRKVAVLLGEGIWRWRLYDYATALSHERFDGLISALVQYLALKADKRFFRLNYERSFMENEHIVFGAELYNDAYEPVNDAEVNMLFRDEEGREYVFAFSRTNNAYRLDAGSLPSGTYTFTASVKRMGEMLEERGQITVKPFALESAELTADHSLLKAITEGTGGSVYYPGELDRLRDDLKASERLKSVSYSTERFNNALNLKWIFFLILTLLSLEWFLRKRSGNY